MGDSPDLKGCVGGAGLALGDVHEALKDIGHFHLVDGLKKLADALKEVPVAMKECKATESDMKGIVHVLTHIGGIKQFAFHTGADVITFFGDIKQELHDAGVFCENEELKACGKEMGMAVRRIATGKA